MRRHFKKWKRALSDGLTHRQAPGMHYRHARCSRGTLAVIFAGPCFTLHMFIHEDSGPIGRLLTGKIRDSVKAGWEMWWVEHRVQAGGFVFVESGQLLSLSIFHLFLTVCPPVFLPFSLPCSCFSLSKALVGNMKQVESEKMKVGRDRTEAGSEIALESAYNVWN